MPLVVGQLDESLAAQGTIILLILVALLVLLQRVLDFKLLPAGAAGVRLLVNPHVGLQFFRATEGFVTFRTSTIVFFNVNLQVFVEVFWEGKVLLTIRARVALAVGSFAMGHYVSFQMV